jgi:hypothetical protein
MTTISGVFADRVITAGLQPAQSTDLKLCDYLWSCLRDQSYKRSAHKLNELTENIQEKITRISPAELQSVNQSVLTLQFMSKWGTF